MYSLKNIKLLRNKFKNQKLSIGGWMQIPNSSIAEIFGNSDFEWVVIDMEHGAIDLSQLPDIIRSLELSQTISFVRIPKSYFNLVNQILDCGANGIILANCNDSIDLKNLINNSTMPPKGRRGVGFSRANLFGKYLNKYQTDLIKPFFIAQIENKLGYKNLNKIVKVQGLDAILIGPYDLSASLNMLNDFKSDKFKKIINQIKNTCKRNKIACGIHVVNNETKDLLSAINQGFNFIPFSTDGQILNKSISKLNLKKYI